MELSKHRDRQEAEQRHVIVLEFLAASAVFLVVVAALVLVLTYKPA